MSHPSEALAPNCPEVHEHALSLNELYTFRERTINQAFGDADREQNYRREVSQRADLWMGDAPIDETLRSIRESQLALQRTLRATYMSALDYVEAMESMYMQAVVRHTEMHRNYGGCEPVHADVAVPPANRAINGLRRFFGRG